MGLFDKNVVRRELHNGLCYYLKKNKTPKKSVEIRIIVKAGSLHEDTLKKGIAHFIEHLCIKKIVNIKETFNTIKILVNAHTNYEETVYSFRCYFHHKEKLDELFKKVSDIVGGLYFTNEQIEKEREILLKELKQVNQFVYKQMSDKILSFLLVDSIYSDRKPIGDLICIKNITQQDIEKFYKKWYQPHRIAIVAIGDLNIYKTENLIKLHFAQIKLAGKKCTTFSCSLQNNYNYKILMLNNYIRKKNEINIIIKYDLKNDNLSRDTFLAQYIFKLFYIKLTTSLQEMKFPLDGCSFNQDRIISPCVFYIFSFILTKKITKYLIHKLIKLMNTIKNNGLTEDEYKICQLSLIKELKTSYKERKYITSGELANECVRNFLYEEPILTLKEEYRIRYSLYSYISIDKINKKIFDFLSKKNIAIVIKNVKEE